MLNDYKGEKPSNVITEEEHKKRPFYKKVSFWVLSVLGLFFGGCSVYGLVLGYQYVHAVTEAAHIIADANGSEEESVPVRALVKHRDFAFNAVGDDIACVDLGSFTWTVTSSNRAYTFLDRNIVTNSGVVLGDYVCSGFTQATYNNLNTYPLNYDNSFAIRLNNNVVVFQFRSTEIVNDTATPASVKVALSGLYLYYHMADPSAGTTAHDQFYDEGHQDGYQEGYDDGSDAINLPQSVKVLLPVGNEYSVQYKTYLDGVVDRQGQLNSSQTGGAYATFDRSRTQKLRIDLTLPSGSRAFFLYTPSWTASYPTDENYSLRQSWGVSGVTYLPTWVSKPQIYVGVTPADVPDLTYETISVAFDVDHWGDIKVGAYSQGYNDGYQAGEENPTAYDSGYDAGYEQGYDDGHTLGVAQGESQAVSGQKALVNMFVTAFQQPFDQIYRFLNFNVLGLNILALFTALLTLSIGIIIIKKVI